MGVLSKISLPPHAPLRILQALLLYKGVKWVWQVMHILLGKRPGKGHPGTQSHREAAEFHAVPRHDFEGRFIGTPSNLLPSYDFIVVGAGSAGCVAARRLAESGKFSVLLIEAGGEAHNAPSVINLNKVPGLWKTEVDWGFASTPQQSLQPRGRIIELERGKTLGGTSCLNYCMWVRATAEDHNRWAGEYGLGDAWSYAGVLENYKNLETVTPSSLSPHSTCDVGDFRGTKGGMHIATATPAFPEVDSFLDACQANGIPLNPDYNSAKQEGCAYTQYSLKGGRRGDAFTAFIEPILVQCPNLTVVSETFVRELTIEKGSSGEWECRGVLIELASGDRVCIKAAREVILSAGALQSPQLLMVSGIGERAHLESVGVGCKVDLPAVGQHMQDHPGLIVGFLTHEGRGPTPVQHSSGIAGCALIQSDVGKRRERKTTLPIGPDVELLMLSRLNVGFAKKLVFSQLVDGFPLLGRFQCMTNIAKWLATRIVQQDSTRQVFARVMAVAVVLHKPLARGSVRLASADPAAHPIVDLNMCGDEADIETLVENVKRARELIKSEHLWPWVADMDPMPGIHKPGQRGPKAFLEATDAQIREFVLASVGTVWHFSCTVRMGPSDAPLTEAALDPSLRVRGVKNLRVADCSVFPEICSANTNCPAMMVGDKCAELILKDHSSG